MPEKLIQEDELDQIQLLEASVQIMIENGDVQLFSEACETSGRDVVVGLMYSQFVAKYDGSLRGMSMMRRSPFYDNRSF